MGSQEFYSSFKNNPDRPHELRIQKEKACEFAITPFAFLVKRMMVEARNGVVKTDETVKSDIWGLATDQDETRVLMDAREDVSAIFLGSVLIELEHSIKTGICNIENVSCAINMGISGTLVSEFSVGEESLKVEHVSSAKLTNLQTLQEEDPTLALIVQKFECLPENLKRFLRKNFQGEFNEELLKETSEKWKFVAQMFLQQYDEYQFSKDGEQIILPEGKQLQIMPTGAELHLLGLNLREMEITASAQFPLSVVKALLRVREKINPNLDTTA